MGTKEEEQLSEAALVTNEEKVAIIETKSMGTNEEEQLSEAILVSNEEEAASAGEVESLSEEAHHAIASRGKDLILRSREKTVKEASAAEAAVELEVNIERLGPMTEHRLTSDAEELAFQRCMSGQPAQMASLCPLLVLDADGNVASSGWEEHSISLKDAKLWALSYSGQKGRFRCIVDLRSEGLSVDCEECSDSATGFAIALRGPSCTLKLAPKRYKMLLEWSAALFQALNESAQESLDAAAHVNATRPHGNILEFGLTPSLETPEPSEPLQIGMERTSRVSSSASSVRSHDVPAALPLMHSVPEPDAPNSSTPDSASWAAHYRKNRRRGSNAVPV